MHSNQNCTRNSSSNLINSSQKELIDAMNKHTCFTRRRLSCLLDNPTSLQISLERTPWCKLHINHSLIGIGQSSAINKMPIQNQVYEVCCQLHHPSVWYGLHLVRRLAVTEGCRKMLVHPDTNWINCFKLNRMLKPRTFAKLVLVFQAIQAISQAKKTRETPWRNRRSNTHIMNNSSKRLEIPKLAKSCHTALW